MTLELAGALAAVVGADHVRPIPGQPALAVTPGSPTELADVVRITADAGAAVVPVGAGFRAARVRTPIRPPRLEPRMPGG